METPSLNVKPKEKIDFKINVKFQIDNISYNIKLGKIFNKEEELIIMIKEENIISSGYYQISLPLGELYKISKCFRFFDTIDETIESLKDIINDKKINIKKNNDSLELIMKLNKGGKGEEEVNLKLSKNNLETAKIIDYLIEQMNEMKKEIYNNKKEIQKINDIIQKYLSDKFILDGIDSKILKNNEELNLISNRIKNTDLLKNKKIKYELLYRGSRDGMTPSFFHQKCNGICPTISIIRTSKGLKFGGYTEKTWENNSSGAWIDDNNSFLFSVDYMKIYNGIKGQILHNNNYGPTFNSSIYLQNDFTQNGNNTCQKTYSNQYYSGFIRDYELNDGQSNFTVSEVEVFKVILE